MEEYDVSNNDVKNVAFNVTINKRCKKQIIEEQKRDKFRKRVEAENWTFDSEHYLYENQLNMMKKIFDNGLNYTDNISKIALQQINKKIYGYRQQDILKKLLDEECFINLQSIVNKMIECALKCYYCKCEMNVLYDISREMRQWTVDRINNDLGHNLDNYYLACLECNLKRRRRSDEKFLFTKQLKIVKTDLENS